MIDTLSHFQEFSLRFPRLPDFLRVSPKDWKVEGGEGNLGFLRLDFFLPPFSKTGLSHLHSQISYSLEKWKLGNILLFVFWNWEKLGNFLLHNLNYIQTQGLGHKWNRNNVCKTSSVLFGACKIWGVYIRQEIVKYLSGPFISRGKYIYTQFHSNTESINWREILKGCRWGYIEYCFRILKACLLHTEYWFYIYK